MTTEKEFWEFAGRYFRTLTSIENIINDLSVDSAFGSKDVRALKSMKRIENVMKEFDGQKPTDQTIDEGCVGCAGPCKVVDVYANLQKELDECSHTNSFLHEELGAIMGQLADSRKRCGYLSKTIDEFKTIETRETDRLHKIIDELKDQNIKDLKELYELDKEDIGGLEAELSARKHDSEVLEKVIGMIRTWIFSIEPRTTINDIRNVVKDYIDAPEVPPETTTDDPQEIEVTFTFMEINQEE